MTDIDWKQLEADRAAGTPGPWQARYQGVNAEGSCDTFDGPVWGRIATAELLRDEDIDGRQWFAPGNDKANARRIARIPDLEAYALEARAKLEAAEALAYECERAFDNIDGTGLQSFYLALAAWDAAQKG